MKDHGRDSSSRLLERRIGLVCIEALLLSVCKHFGLLQQISEYFFQPLDRFFFKKKVILLRLTFLLYDFLVSRLLVYGKAVDKGL